VSDNLTQLLDLADVSATTLRVNGCFGMADALEALVEAVRKESVDSTQDLS
jgi:hypothetical protein